VAAQKLLLRLWGNVCPVEIRTLAFGPPVGVDLGGLKSRQKDLDQRPLRTEVVLVGDAGYLKDPITVQWINEAFRNAFDQAMINYQRDSDAKVLPMYEFSRQLASLELPPPEMQRISAMQRWSQNSGTPDDLSTW